MHFRDAFSPHFSTHTSPHFSTHTSPGIWNIWKSRVLVFWCLDTHSMSILISEPLYASAGHGLTKAIVTIEAIVIAPILGVEARVGAVRENIRLVSNLMLRFQTWFYSRYGSPVCEGSMRAAAAVRSAACCEPSRCHAAQSVPLQRQGQACSQRELS